MKPPNAGKGRPKGSKNKASGEVKALLLKVNDKLGGEKAMLTWAQSNQTEFYKLLGRLITTEISGPDGGDIPVGVKVIERVIRPAN